MPAPADQPRWPENIPWSPRGPAPGRWRSRADATSWTDLLYQRITGQPVWADRSRVALQALGRPTSRRRLGGGAIAETEVLTYADGSAAIRKIFGGEADDRLNQHRASAEYMASLVAQAVGATAPAVVKDPTDPEHSVIMGRVTGDMGTIHTGEASAEEWGQALYYLTQTDGGLRIGLLDVLIANQDRHSMNWLLSDQMADPHPWNPTREDMRRPIAIDHSEAFPLATLAQAYHFRIADPQGQPLYTMPLEVGAYGGFFTPWMQRTNDVVDMLGNPVAQAPLLGAYAYRDGNPLHPDDVPVLRARLERLKSLFEDEPTGHLAYQDMMARFEQLAARAGGRERMFPDV